MGNLNDFISGLGKQQERKTEQIKIAENPVLEELVKVYAVWLDERKPLSWEGAYESSIRKIKDLAYSSKDITQLCLRLKDYEQHEQFEWSGLFLSALINHSKENDFLLITEHLDKDIRCIGYKNAKKIIVEGNTQNNTGQLMSGGSITIEGNTGEYTGGWMNNGVIKVFGNIQSISQNWKDGKIYCKEKLVRGKE